MSFVYRAEINCLLSETNSYPIIHLKVIFQDQTFSGLMIQVISRVCDSGALKNLFFNHLIYLSALYIEKHRVCVTDADSI